MIPMTLYLDLKDDGRYVIKSGDAVIRDLGRVDQVTAYQRLVAEQDDLIQLLKKTAARNTVTMSPDAVGILDRLHGVELTPSEAQAIAEAAIGRVRTKSIMEPAPPLNGPAKRIVLAVEIPHIKLAYAKDGLEGVIWSEFLHALETRLIEGSL